MKPTYSFRKMPTLQKYGVAVRFFPRYVNLTPKLHSVDTVLISVILRGKGRHLLGEESYDEAGGSIAVTHYEQQHDVVTDRHGMDIYNVYLDLRNHPLPLLPPSLRATATTILPVHPRLLHALNRRLWFRISNPDQLFQSLSRMESEMDEENPGAEEILRHSFQIFLIDICRDAQRNGVSVLGASDKQFPNWLEKLRRQLDEEFHHSITLEDLADEAGVSITYLCRVFKEYTGRTIVEYLVERRIQSALWKLRDSDEKIITIALGSGFNDLAYFNRTFRRIVGTTPSAYRRRFRGE